jgi:hypothetical protein
MRFTPDRTVHYSGKRGLSPLTVFAIAALVVGVSACAPNPERERLKATTKATYDPRTGKLTRLTYDSNKNGVIDTWTYMDGARPVRSEIDKNEDVKIDRWEYYGEDGKLVKVGLSRADDGKQDAWAYPTADGRIARVEVSTKRDGKIDRLRSEDQPGTAETPDGQVQPP